MVQAHDVEIFGEKSRQLLAEISKDMIGQEDVVEDTVIAMVSGGNVLLEGVPGVGKTRLVRSLGRAFDLPFSRIQFTPDLMPADVTGTNIIEQDENGQNRLVFQRGPIFSSIILADEINRATPKTQSALLEAMQEHTVTAGGNTYRLEEPFFVLATQNPIEQDGTYPLPEAQMDRFMFKLLVTFPTPEELAKIVTLTQVTMDETANAVLNAKTLLEMRAVAKEIPISSEILDYTVRLVEASHPERDDAPEFTRQYVRFGASPRAAQNLITSAKARALMDGRFNVSFEDIDTLAYPVLRHRVKPSFLAVTEKIDADTLIYMLLEEVNGRKVSSDPKDVAMPKKKRKRLFG
ncbi:MAG: MoxR family ATPase [Oscillospiraceae bacterium]|nr:MoxR family ATPase [Oscillospiraceae bacterium]